jgi:hypothetical protein
MTTERWLPSVAILAVLIAVAAVLLGMVGASDAAPLGTDLDAAGDPASDPVGDIAGACLEGSIECIDTVDLPVDGGPEPICIERTVDCDGIIEDPPITAQESPDAVVQLTVDFDGSVTQPDIEGVSELIVSIDPSADVLILERFPPAASAIIRVRGAGVCEDLVARLETLPAVAAASCADYKPSGGDPDGPVSSDPPEKPPAGEGVLPSAGECPPDAIDTEGGCAVPGFDPGAVV